MIKATMHRDGSVTLKDEENLRIDQTKKVGKYTMIGTKSAPFFRFKDNYDKASPMYTTLKELRTWIEKNVQPIMK